MMERPIWTAGELEESRVRSVALFRRERLEEPREIYTDYFDRYKDVLDDLLERTTDLSRLDEEALGLMSDSDVAIALRYLTGPPVSQDDLEVLAETKLSGKSLRSDPEAVGRIVTYLRDNLDRGRFPWLDEANESERTAAVLATAGMIAMRRTETSRRAQGKKEQEALVSQALEEMGLQRVNKRIVSNFKETPEPGTFFPECTIGGKKADFLIGLFDNRALTIECKVSNSYTNSIKRLNDASSRAILWSRTLGSDQMVGAAVISGVFKLRNLEDAQKQISLFWAHDVSSLVTWIESTKKRT